MTNYYGIFFQYDSFVTQIFHEFFLVKPKIHHQCGKAACAVMKDKQDEKKHHKKIPENTKYRKYNKVVYIII